MSQKFTAKNLQYNTTLPPFLARLRGEAPFDTNSPDPILAARRRPTKKRSGSAEAEDLPTVVDERGNTVRNVTLGADGSATVVEDEAAEEEGGKANETTSTAPGEDGSDKATTPTTTTEKDGKTNIGASKKRKVGKVIGQDHADDDDDGQPPKKGKNTVSTTASDINSTAEADKPPRAKKAKAKKIKLSFGDEEEG